MPETPPIVYGPDEKHASPARFGHRGWEVDMADGDELVIEIEVPGSTEEVWAAVATGPGISSWYVPHLVEERTGGAASASFGPGMDVPGIVSVWDPPRMVRFEGTEDGPGLAFDWSVEPADDDMSIVRLVNSGFGSGDDWNEAFYNAMQTGWTTFFANLRLHLQHFRGQVATPSLAMAPSSSDRGAAWSRVLDALGFDSTPEAGDEFRAAGGTTIAGTIAEVVDGRISMTLTEPAPGTGFVAAEKQGGEQVVVSVWLYLYGDQAEALAAKAYESWTEWLAANV